MVFQKGQPPPKRGRGKHGNRKAFIHTTRTGDPVLSYIYGQAKTYGLGEIPVRYGGPTREEAIKECRDRTEAVAISLFGDGFTGWRFTHNLVGVTRETIWHVRGTKTNSKTPVHLRLYQLVMLQHINGIRQTLSDLERELWVTLQLTHHPILQTAAHGKAAETASNASKKKIRADIGSAKRAKSVKVDSHTKLLPVRALASIKHPDMEPIQAIRKELEAISKLPKGRLLDKLIEGAQSE